MYLLLIDRISISIKNDFYLIRYFHVISIFSPSLIFFSSLTLSGFFQLLPLIPSSSLQTSLISSTPILFVNFFLCHIVVENKPIIMLYWKKSSFIPLIFGRSQLSFWICFDRSLSLRRMIRDSPWSTTKVLRRTTMIASPHRKKKTVSLLESRFGVLHNS